MGVGVRRLVKRGVGGWRQNKEDAAGTEWNLRSVVMGLRSWRVREAATANYSLWKLRR